MGEHNHSIRHIKTKSGLVEILFEGIVSWEDGVSIRPLPRPSASSPERYLLHHTYPFDNSLLKEPFGSGKRDVSLTSGEASIMGLLMSRERYFSNDTAARLLYEGDKEEAMPHIRHTVRCLRRKFYQIAGEEMIGHIGTLNGQRQVISGYYAGDLRGKISAIMDELNFPPSHGMHWAISRGYGLFLEVNNEAKYVLGISGWGKSFRHPIKPEEGRVLREKIENLELLYGDDVIIFFNNPTITRANADYWGHSLLSPSPEFYQKNPQLIQQFHAKELIQPRAA